MDPVHGEGPWTWSMKGVHGPGPKRGSMFCPLPDGYVMIIRKSVVTIFCFYFIFNQVYVVSAL